MFEDKLNSQFVLLYRLNKKNLLS